MDRKEFIKNEINQDPKDPFNHYLLGIEYLKENAIKDAFEQFEAYNENIRFQIKVDTFSKIWNIEEDNL